MRYYFALSNSQGGQGTQYYRATRIKSIDHFESLLRERYPNKKVFIKIERDGLSSIYYTLEGN